MTAMAANILKIEISALLCSALLCSALKRLYLQSSILQVFYENKM